MLNIFMEEIGFQFLQEDLEDKIQFKNFSMYLNDFNYSFIYF